MHKAEYLYAFDGSDLESTKLLVRKLLVNRDDELAMHLHPLGFLHSVLIAEGCLSIRLHVWPASGRATQTPYWPIHNHVFDLMSFVLVGEIVNRTYIVNTVSSAADYKIFETKYSDVESILEPTEIYATAQPNTEEVVPSGSQYYIPAGRYHETLVRSGVFVVTAALTKTIGGRSQVLGDLL